MSLRCIWVHGGCSVSSTQRYASRECLVPQLPSSRLTQACKISLCQPGAARVQQPGCTGLSQCWPANGPVMGDLVNCDMRQLSGVLLQEEPGISPHLWWSLHVTPTLPPTSFCCLHKTMLSPKQACPFGCEQKSESLWPHDWP